MKVFVIGKQIDVGQSLREYIEQHAEKSVKKYFDNAIDAHFYISKIGKEHNFFHVNVTVNEGSGNKVIIKADSTESDAYRAIDTALKRIETQLRRYKKKIRGHHAKVKDVSNLNILAAKKYIITPFEEDEQEAEGEAPLIVAEKPAEVETLSVSDAVMRMDLLNLPALVFINSSNQRLNVVYYRKDGNISWVDTTVSTTSK